MNKKVKILFEDMSISSNYQLLEWGKDDDELKSIASKRGLNVPSKDLSIFKCKYAMIDEANKNKCTLPRKEVKKALKTLNGKAIDKDHFRKATIGYWLDAEIEDNDIIAYGAFWKSNFPDDYEIIQDRLTKGKMKISFEAWGDRQFKEDGSYNLTNIEFAGGALLFDTEPAFPDAEVMTFANRALEFAKIMEEGIQMEEARLNFFSDGDNIARVLGNTTCGNCKMVGWHDVLAIDFEQSKIKHKCINCSSIYETDLTPQTILKKKGKTIKPIKATEETKDNVDLTKDTTTDRVADEITAKSNENDEKGRNIEDAMEKTVEQLNQEIATLTAKVKEYETVLSSKDQELATLKKSLEESKLMIDNAKLETEKVLAEAKTVKEELDKRVTAEKAAFVKARRDELGEEFAKDISDEDISNDLKFENAKLRKEIATIKKEVKPVEKAGLEQGKEIKSKDEGIYQKQGAIQTRAFGEEQKA